MKLKKIIKESRLEPEQRKTFLEAVARFTEYGKHIYRESQFTKKIIENMQNLMSGASNFIIDESDDWFDTVTIKRDSKAIGNSAKDFTKCATEMAMIQQRLESLYEDLGHKLGRYYEISEAVDNIDDKEAAQDFDDLKDKDVDNDGDTDDSDKYLHKRLGTVAKKTEGYKTLKEAFEGVGGVVTLRPGKELRFNYSDIREAAPKMITQKWHKELDQATQSVIRADNMMKLEEPGSHGKIKNSFKKTIKQIQTLKSDTRR